MEKERTHQREEVQMDEVQGEKAQKEETQTKRDECPSFRQVMRTFFRMIRLGMPNWILCFLGSSIVGLMYYGVVLVIGLLSSLSLIHFRAGTSAVPTVAGLMLALLGIVVVQLVGLTMNMSSSMRIRTNIQQRLLSAWIRQTEAFASRHHSGDAMALVTSDMSILEDFYFQGLTYQFLVPLIQGIAATVTIVSIDYRLLVPPVITGLISFLFSVRLSGQVQEKNKLVRTETDHMTRVFSEIAMGNEAYRSMGMVPRVLADYFQQSEEYAELCAKTDNISVDIKFFITLMGALSEISFLGLGLWLSATGRLDFAMVLLAFPVQMLVSEMMGCFGPAWNFIIAAGIAGERIMGGLKWPQEEENKEEDLQSVGRSFSRHLTLSKVDFRYEEEKPILRQFSADISAGRKLALVGPSGSGKSTVLQLLLRFYQEDSGTITLDGENASKYSLEAWRSAFVLLQQDASLLAKTVGENIAMGRYGDGSEPTEAEILAAAKAAGIHDFIMSLPEQYQTLVTEGGKSFSGGQRQRLAIARAFMSNAPIVLLDEPTAALDPESEQLVQQSLVSLMEGRTVIMVAHRLETVRDFDEIIVLDHGNTVQRGTHDQLMKQGGLYAQMYRIQTQAQTSEKGSLSQREEEAPMLIR